ncbi:MAG: cache domain-containing protein [Thermodesulfovibrionales bacterium]|nr:cache domain-containing protein [Thermodesulfovibrionales bacterium]
MIKKWITGSVNNKLITGIAAFTLLLIAMFVVLSYLSFRKSLQITSLKSINSIKERYDSIYNPSMNNDVRMLTATMMSFQQDQLAKQLFKKRDRERLYSTVKTLFQKNRDHSFITHFYFIDPDGTCFLRVHNPNNYGDIIKRVSFHTAKSTTDTGVGIEFGRSGVFALRVVTPYYDEGNLIGFLEMAEELDHFDKTIKQETESDVVILMDKKLIDEKEYKSFRKNNNKEDDWDKLKGYVIANSTYRDLNFLTLAL